MELKAYRQHKGLSVIQAAGELGVTPECWHYWEGDRKKPNDENMERIHIWSGGQVEPNDFYNFMRGGAGEEVQSSAAAAAQ